MPLESKSHTLAQSTLQAAHLKHIAIGTEQVEDVVTVDSPVSQSIQHQHRPTSSHCWRAHDTIGASCCLGRGTWEESRKH